MVLLDGRAHEEHILQTPWDRLVSEGGNVDWFDFWLNGHEDSNPAKAQQYRRWEKLCDMQRMQNPDRPTFCVPAQGYRNQRFKAMRVAGNRLPGKPLRAGVPVGVSMVGNLIDYRRMTDR
jgi:hypothetical protein